MQFTLKHSQMVLLALYTDLTTGTDKLIRCGKEY